MDPPCSWIRTLNTVKMAVFPKMSHRFNTGSFTIPPAFSAETDKMILESTWECKGEADNQKSLGKEHS